VANICIEPRAHRCVRTPERAVRGKAGGCCIATNTLGRCSMKGGCTWGVHHTCLYAHMPNCGMFPQVEQTLTKQVLNSPPFKQGRLTVQIAGSTWSHNSVAPQGWFACFVTTRWVVPGMQGGSALSIFKLPSNPSEHGKGSLPASS